MGTDDLLLQKARMVQAQLNYNANIIGFQSAGFNTVRAIPAHGWLFIVTSYFFSSTDVNEMASHPMKGTVRPLCRVRF